MRGSVLGFFISGGFSLLLVRGADLLHAFSVGLRRMV